MQGQWLGKIEGDFSGTIRIELENRGDIVFGNAYLFYDFAHALPGFKFPIRMAKKAPYVAEVETIYCYSGGGSMTSEERQKAEMGLTERFGALPMPGKLQVTFEEATGGDLTLKWEGEGKSGTQILQPSTISDESKLVSNADLTTWTEFRQWAVNQKPRCFIFRGQENPSKLATAFHRTWRNDLNSWIVDDVRIVFGAIVERISYPLQLGNLDHNAAIWSILQHHGYPTPLLDWTFSPFVAAFFAFQNVRPDDNRRPRIFLFDKAGWEEKHGRQAFIVDAAPPQLVTLENLAVGNPRSGPQQALSTVSNVADIEAFIRGKEEEDGRIYLTVCDLAPSEAPQIIRELELMGITYGSLFPGLDGICRDLKDRLFAQAG
jgi:hypothetical protein